MSWAYLLTLPGRPRQEQAGCKAEGYQRLCANLVQPRPHADPCKVPTAFQEAESSIHALDALHNTGRQASEHAGRAGFGIGAFASRQAESPAPAGQRLPDGEDRGVLEIQSPAPGLADPA